MDRSLGSEQQVTLSQGDFFSCSLTLSTTRVLPFATSGTASRDRIKSETEKDGEQNI